MTKLKDLKMTEKEKEYAEIEKDPSISYYARKYAATHDEFYQAKTEHYDMNGNIRAYECEVGCKKIDIHNRVVFTSDLRTRSWKAGGDALQQLSDYLEGCGKND